MSGRVPDGPAPEAGGAAESLEVERASATPVTPRRGRARRIAPLPPAADVDLPTTLAWLLDAIQHPVSARAGARRAAARHGVAIDALLTRGPETDTLTRLGVYQYAYHARLIEALADDFPTVRHALGPVGFARLAGRVIQAHPSRTRNLNTYGRVLVEHLADPRQRVPGRAFLAELARLEWALVEVVHAPTPPRLDAEALRALPPERWATLRFLPGEAVRLLRFRWPVNAYLQAVRTGGEPPLPSRGASATVVYRQGFTVWRMDLSPVASGLLEALMAGVPLGEALAPLEGRARAERVMDWFSAWVAGGVFARVEDAAG